MTDTSKIVVAHDYFGIRGGGERLVLTLANLFGAALVFGYRNEQSFPADMFPSVQIELGLISPLRRPGLRTMLLASRFASSRAKLRPYEIRIFSGISAPFAAEVSQGARNIYYCHTPPRFLYDQREYFSAMLPRTYFSSAMLARFRQGYESAVGNMQTIIANSMTVRDRIQKYLGRDSEVVYPPCNLNAFRWKPQQGYYLSTARLSPLKRVNRIVEAFVGMPDKQLVVVSGGADLKALQYLARDSSNIRFLGWVSDSHLQQLIGEAIATIYVPVDEDFGMSPVESMAAGKPVIGVAEGGLRETIIDGEVGMLLPPSFSVEMLQDAVQSMTATLAGSMMGACIERAGLFSESVFCESMKRIIEAESNRL
jgi:glycosyltransferase involved in cell wall biosynthesis